MQPVLGRKRPMFGLRRPQPSGGAKGGDLLVKDKENEMPVAAAGAAAAPAAKPVAAAPATVARRPAAIARPAAAPLARPAAHSKMDSKTDALPSRYYTVLYTKRAPNKKRKNKAFSDGFLEVKGDGSCTLWDEGGSVVGRGKNRTAAAGDGLEDGSQLDVGSWELEVDQPLDEASFRSGSCFLSSSSSMAAAGVLGPAGSGLGGAAPRPRPLPQGGAGAGGRFKPVVRPAGAGAGGKGGTGTAPTIQRPQPGPPQALHDPYEPDALICNEQQWRTALQAAEAAGDASRCTVAPVVVDPYLRRHLRPHQRQGVQFLYEAVMGLRMAGRSGAILADDMGLGKTLQVLALVWTLIRQGPQGKPVARRVIVVTPSSLTRNWGDEARKWLGVERLNPMVVQPGPEAAQQVADFRHGTLHRMLVISYETLRKFAAQLAGCCDLLVCDEGHRLKKAGGNKTISALLQLGCARHVLLTGTPMQNNLDEFYAMMSFVAPDLLGSLAKFKSVFGAPISKAQDREATQEDKDMGRERSAELARRVEPLVLRRTAAINQKYLPPLSTFVVWCQPTPLQVDLYRHVLRSGSVSRLLGGGTGSNAGGGGEYGDMALTLITQLRKVCNHPDLAPDLMAGLRQEQQERREKQQHHHHMGSGGGGGGPSSSGKSQGPPVAGEEGAAGAGDDGMQAAERQSGKMRVLAALLRGIVTKAGERVVVVSNSTQALDVAAAMCADMGYSTARIDGSTEVAKRQDVVTAFNKRGVGQVFLLSTRAGGAGLNLVGACRLVLLDSDWNPAMDLQAMARIWRDGQRKPCTVYRLLTAGTIDEKIFQRQLAKGSLAAAMKQGGGGKGGKGGGSGSFTRDELRELFRLHEDSPCQTRDLLMEAGAAGQDWEDQRDSVQDGPLQTAVRGGSVTWVTKQAAPHASDDAPGGSSSSRLTPGSGGAVPGGPNGMTPGGGGGAMTTPQPAVQPELPNFCDGGSGEEEEEEDGTAPLFEAAAMHIGAIPGAPAAKAAGPARGDFGDPSTATCDDTSELELVDDLE